MTLEVEPSDDHSLHRKGVLSQKLIPRVPKCEVHAVGRDLHPALVAAEMLQNIGGGITRRQLRFRFQYFEQGREMIRIEEVVIIKNGDIAFPCLLQPELSSSDRCDPSELTILTAALPEASASAASVFSNCACLSLA